MADSNRFKRVTFQLMEQLLEVNNLEEALSGSLEIIVRELDSEAGAIWLLDKKTNRLAPVFHIGPTDISNISIENGIGIEGLVTKTGKSMLVSDAANSSRRPSYACRSTILMKSSDAIRSSTKRTVRNTITTSLNCAST